jgi:gliding motility-associated-like protein
VGTYTVGAGNYNYTVTDANGCTSTTSAIVSQPTLLTISASSTPVTCNGGNNGSVTVTSNGGTTPYSVSGLTTNLSAGTYNYIVTDANGCTVSTNATVNEPGALVANGTTTPASCGNNNGSASVLVSGGTQGYTYSINNGLTSQGSGTFSNLLAGSYSILITDANGCTVNAIVNVANTSSPSISSISQTPNSCFNSNNGTIQIIASGGTGSLQYSINGGSSFQTGNTFSNLAAGSYNIVVVDALGCQTTSTTILTQPAPLSATNNVTNIACFGGTASVNISANGGTSPYSGTGTFTVTAGAYSYTVTDANGCTTSTSINITQPTLLTTSTSTNPVSCNGGSNGSLMISAIGGTTPYSGTGSVNNLAAGNYSYVITDANGCTSTATATINQPPALSATTNSTPSTCGNADGSITINANGGVSPYTYNTTGSYQSSNQFNNVLSGSYTVIVQDANGCTFTTSVNVANQSAPSVLSVVPTNVTCYGASNGSATIAANGGTGTLQYSIDNGSTFQNSNTFNNLSPGNYQVVVTDANGCTAISTFVISQPTQLNATFNTVNTTCTSANGTISVNATGGTPGYQYSFNNGASFQNNPTLSGILSGTYNILVTDINGCSSIGSATLTDAPGPVVSNVSASNITCFGLINGSATININGGSNPVTYSLNSGAPQSTGIFNNLSNGSYTVLITDANGCTANSNFNISQPTAINASYSSINSTCGNSDGSITIAASGGIGGYTYSLNNGSTSQGSPIFNLMPAGSYNILITDANGCTQTISASINNSAAPIIQSSTSTNISCNGSANGSITVISTGGTGTLVYNLNGGPSQTSGVFNNLGPGTYTISVSDNNGCTASTQATISQPSVLVATGSSTSSTCGNNNGSLNFTAQGGTAPFSYSLNAGSSQSSNSFNNLVQGTYTLLVTDANGCTTSLQTQVAGAPGPILTQGVATNITCNGLSNGSIQIVSTGGTAPIQYSINGGTTYSSTSSFQNLGPGSYNLMITDANGCTSVSSTTISQPLALGLTASTTNSTCGQSDGSIIISANGGTTPYSFSINGGLTYQPIASFNSLPAGSYNLVLTDANGCSLTGTTIINNDAAPTIASSTSDDITCYGLGNGTINIVAAGGTGPLTYILNGGTPQNSGAYSGLGPGIYNIVISDINGCTTTSQLTINEPQLLSVNATNTPATCGNANGTISITSNGGISPYTYTINGTSNGNSNSITGIGQGVYSIVVTDQNGCSVNTSTNISNIAGPTLAAISSTNVTCNGQNNGAISIATTGGTTPIQYSINNGSTNSINSFFGNLAPGNYSVLVTDANGCTTAGNAQITQPTSLSINSTSSAATCGSNNGSFNVSANGGMPPYQYSGNAGVSFQPSGNFIGYGPGSYSIVVTDASGCSTNGNVSISNSAAPVVTSIPVSNITCNGYGNGSLTINVNGGVAPITYSINGGFTTSTNNTFSNLGPGSYNILVTDGNGCTGSSTATISQPSSININSTTTNASCGNSDGTATISATGGSGTLNYSLNGGPGQTLGSFTNLAAGNYNIIVTDQSGCTSSIVASVSNNTAPIISNVNGTPVDCSGNSNGTITINANGGTAPLTYSIDNGTNYQSSPFFTALSGGTYSISVLDANGCLATSNISINEPVALTISTLQTNTTCGNANGTISSLATGGSTPYSYSINNGSTSQTTGSFVGLSSGNYSVLITDNNGCTAISTVNISNLAGPVALLALTTNITCFGLTNGSITANATGGSQPLYYSLNGGSAQSSNYFGNLAQGPYSITITDVNGCTATANSNITSPSQINLSVFNSNSTCGNANGTIIINASGGTGALNYSNNGGLTYQANGSFTGLGSGNYSIVVTDANGCSSTTSSSIAGAPGPVLSNQSSNNISCYNQSNGNITVTASNGTAPLSYSISSGLTQPTGVFNNLSAGNYTITVTDANGCSAATTQLLTQPSALLTSIASTPSTCQNGTNGSANVSVSGGTTPYTYTWSGSTSTTNTANNLVSGSYSVTITDNNGCSTNLNTTVNNIPGPNINSITTVDNTCFQSNNGTAITQISGGTGPFNYALNGTLNQSSGSFTNLPAGPGSITVSDNNGCTSTLGFVISQPQPVSLSSIAVSSTCGNSNGNISFVANGGTAPYTYSNNGGLSYQPNPVFNNLTAGNYNISVMDANGCTATSTDTIGDLTGPTIVSNTFGNPTCYNSGNGTITLAASGNGPLNYSINNGVNNQSSPIFSGLGAGSYNILVTDVNGCTVTTNSVITEPDPLISITSTNPSICNNGTNGNASVAVQGGTLPYVYLWNTGAVSSSISNVPAGSYTITVTDANGCTSIQNAIVANISGPSISTVLTSDNSCFQSNNGGVSITISSGTGPFNFNLNGTANQSNGVFTNLPAGPGSILITDNNGCTTTATFVINQPSPLTFASQNSSSTCGNNNGALSLSGSGGTSPYTFSNNGGTTYQAQGLFQGLNAGNYIVSIMDANGCITNNTETINDLAGPILTSTAIINPSCFNSTDGIITLTANGNGNLSYSINNGANTQTNPNFQNLVAGNYSILVTDTNGCTTTGIATLVQPDALMASTITNPSICDGTSNGNAAVSTQGGTPPYSYLWNNGTSATSLNNVIAGIYTITITDNNGCTLQQSVSIGNIASPILTNLSTTNNTCNQQGDGSAIVSVTSGTSPYSYSINGGTTSQNNGAFQNLFAGNYTIIITDANGCTIDSAFYINEPLPISVNLSTIGSVCGGSNGSIIAVANGGTPPYQYSNNNGATFQTGSSFGNMLAGTYPLIITDSNGCILNASATVTDAPGPVLSSISSTNASCNGLADGTVTVVVNGGTNPMTYQLNNGVGQPLSTFTTVSAGVQNILVTDANGCTISATTTISEPLPLTISVGGSTQICIGGSATISASANGGNGGFIFSWNNGVTGSSQTVSPTTATVYTVTVTDSLGCPGSATTVSIGVNPPIQLTITPNDTICEGQSSSIVALANGGDGGPYTYHWSGMTNTGSSLTVSPMMSTSYTVTVTDGCTTPFATANTQVMVNPLPSVDITLNPYQGCIPLTVDFSVLNNTGSGTQYQWDFGDGSNSTSFAPSHTYTEPGTFTIKFLAVSSAGCQRQVILPDTIHAWPIPNAIISATPSVTSILYPIVQFKDVGIGANSWIWDFGDNSSLGNGQTVTHTYEIPNNYEVILFVENQYGCRDTAYTRIIIENESTLYVPNAFTPNGDGVNDMFNVYGIGIQSGTMSIFNRWGQKIFTTDNPEKGWNGEFGDTGNVCSIGVYVYRIDVVTYTGEKRTLFGRVSLVE